MSYRKFLLVFMLITSYVIAFLTITPTLKDIPNIFFGFAIGITLRFFFPKE